MDFQGRIMKWGAGTSITRLDEVSQSKQVTRNDRACVMRSIVGIDVYLVKAEQYGAASSPFQRGFGVYPGCFR